MTQVIFENDGEIDIRAISTFGLSVKESTNPIGFFGTGLKYGIAVLMRTGHQVIVQSGLTNYQINVDKSSVRGKDFDFVRAGDTPIGFTTELGKTWEVWMAYRELFCNTKDESGKVFLADDIPTPQAGKTRVIVSGDVFLKVHESRRDFLLTSLPVYKLGSLEVHSQPSQNFFYRGIKVMQFQRPALFTYNETAQVELTEDRTAKDPYAVLYNIARNILQYGESDFLEKVLMAGENDIEKVFDYHGWTSIEPGRDFFPTVNRLQRDSLIKINSTALRLWREKGKGFIDPRRIHPTKIQSAMLQKAIEFCEKTGFMVKDEYPILVVESLGEGGTLAMADEIGKQIFLAESIFNQDGTKGVARAIIEEYLHLKYKFPDCSREMQNYLFAKMVSLAEELTGEPL